MVAQQYAHNATHFCHEDDLLTRIVLLLNRVQHYVIITSDMDFVKNFDWLQQFIKPVFVENLKITNYGNVLIDDIVKDLNKMLTNNIQLYLNFIAPDIQTQLAKNCGFTCNIPSKIYFTTEQ